MTEHAAMADATADQRALSVDAATLPVIDVGGLLGDDPEAKRAVAAALGAAARTSGFFYIVNHGVPPELVRAVLAASREFHEKPRRFKMRWWSGFTTNHRGYVPFEEKDFPKRMNLNEAWDMSFEAPADHPDHLAGWRMTGPNVWPDIPGWRETVSAYYDAIFALGLRMLDALALELGVDPADLLRQITSPTSQMRLLRYVPNELPKTADIVGIDAHSDFECFTILLQGGPGLQVMNAEDVWIEAPPIEGAFIVNIGDVFETWSGGQFKSTQHRVVNSGRERYSIPLFFGLDYHALMRMSVKAFRYMADALDRGEMTLDFEVPDRNPFARPAKPIDSAA